MLEAAGVSKGLKLVPTLNRYVGDITSDKVTTFFYVIDSKPWVISEWLESLGGLRRTAIHRFLDRRITAPALQAPQALTTLAALGFLGIVFRRRKG